MNMHACYAGSKHGITLPEFELAMHLAKGSARCAFRIVYHHTWLSPRVTIASAFCKLLADAFPVAIAPKLIAERQTDPSREMESELIQLRQEKSSLDAWQHCLQLVPCLHKWSRWSICRRSWSATCESSTTAKATRKPADEHGTDGGWDGTLKSAQTALRTVPRD